MLIDRDIESFLARQMPQPPWVIPDLLSGGGFTLLHGAPKSGKSTLALQMAQALASGDHFLRHAWQPERPWRVTYVQADVSSVEWRGYLLKLDIHGKVAQVHDLDFGCLAKPEGQAAMRAALEELETEYAIFDSAYKLHGPGEDMNTANGVSEMLKQIKACWTSPAFMLVHHSRKEKEGRDDDPIQGAAGHHTMTAAASGVWVLRGAGTATPLAGQLKWSVRLVANDSQWLQRGPSGLWELGEPPQPQRGQTRNLFD